jgi:AcrR family transcriptional regulator
VAVDGLVSRYASSVLFRSGITHIVCARNDASGNDVRKQTHIACVTIPTVTSYQRARTPERKAERARTLVEAARGLATERGVRAVTLTAIADRAGLHHSAMRRYFSSHREVLLRLAGEGWTDFAEAIRTDLGSQGQVDAAGLADALVSALVRDPLFCDLLGNSRNLEEDVDIAYVREFQHIGITAVRSLVESMTRAMPDLTAQGGRDMVRALHAIAGTTWQVTHPPQQLARLYEDEPDLRELAGEFVPAVTRLLTATCIGLTAPSA